MILEKRSSIMNTGGRTLTVFLAVITIVLLSLSGIALFFLQKETELRKVAEASLEQLKTQEAKLQAELKEAKKQAFLLEEKNKEADEKINDLMDNLELEKGLREESKKENENLREALENENKSKEGIRNTLTQQLNSYKEKTASLEAQLTTHQNRVKELEGASQGLQEKIQQLQGDLEKKIQQEAAPQPASPEASGSEPSSSPEIPPAQPLPSTPSENRAVKEIELEKIVVAPQDLPEGRVLSVDKENEFLIFNLGEKQGVVQGLVLSVYRGKEYLGDVKVSRVQPEMSAADFISPFSTAKVRKNDQVVPKK